MRFLSYFGNSEVRRQKSEDRIEIIEIEIGIGIEIEKM